MWNFFLSKKIILIFLEKLQIFVCFYAISYTGRHSECIFGRYLPQKSMHSFNFVAQRRFRVLHSYSVLSGLSDVYFMLKYILTIFNDKCKKLCASDWFPILNDDFFSKKMLECYNAIANIFNRVFFTQKNAQHFLKHRWCKTSNPSTTTGYVPLTLFPKIIYLGVL